MVKKGLDNGATVSPFLVKCYEMVSDPNTNELISWSNDGASFLISDVSNFESQLLPKYFKHNNISSFVRQLNLYGFKKIDTDKYVFASDGFAKGQKNLLKNIHRRKQSQGIVRQKVPVQQNEVDATEAYEEDKKVDGLWSEVACLKADKNSLMQELAKLRQHQENSHDKLVVLREQIKNMEKDQQQMLSFIVMAMQNPGFLVHILQPKEPNWRRAEASKGVFNRVIVDDPEENAPSGEGMIVRYQPPLGQSPTPLNPDNYLGPDTSNDEHKDLFVDIDIPSDAMDNDIFNSETFGPTNSQDQPSGEGMIVRYQPPLNQSPTPLNPDKYFGSDASNDELKDFFTDIDFLSEPMDDDFDPEAFGSIVFADQPHDFSDLEQFLLSSPLHGDKENDNFDSLEWETDSTPAEAQNSKIETLVMGSKLERDLKLEILTEQMGNLASECNMQQ